VNWSTVPVSPGELLDPQRRRHVELQQQRILREILTEVVPA
jgi:hypothetical protein